MPLENLLTLVEKLRERVDDHGPALRQNETLTRYALIDPLLRELGWDTEDPGMVIPEYKPGSGSADYAPLNKGKPVMMLEAKKLDTPLQDAVEQGIKYCMMQGTNYLALTDGRRWEIYETHKPVPIDDKRVVAFDLKDQSATEVCLKALALWRPSVISGRIQAGQTPVIDLTDDPPSTTAPQPIQETSVLSPPTENQPQLSVAEQGWQPLSALNPQKGDSPPTEILFPDQKKVKITTWKAVLVEVARWLIKKGDLNENHCPIRFGRTSYLVDTSSKHSTGKEFRGSEKIESLYV